MKTAPYFFIAAILARLLPGFKISFLKTRQNVYFQSSPSFWAMIPIIDKGIDIRGKAEMRRHV